MPGPGAGFFNQQNIQQQAEAKERARLQEEARVRDLQAQGRNSDGSYVRPEWESLIDPATGMLRNEYQVGKDYKEVALNTDAMDKLRQDAMRDAGTNSAWANLALQQNQANQSGQMSKQAATLNAGLAGAYDDAASMGGLGGASKERIARGGLRDALRGRQDIRATGAGQAMNIGLQDEQNRLSGLKSYQGLEMDRSNYLRGNEEAKIKLQESNIRNALTERTAQRNDQMDAWKKNQEVWASGKQADAQKQSSGGGGGCCFIFLEARYGNGTMDSVVRKFRDEHMTDRNKRGYYKLSEVLVPLMRKSPVVKFLTRALLTDPLLQYGKYHYGQNKWGVIFKPVKNFWLKAFDYLGQDHKFIRENGETV